MTVTTRARAMEDITRLVADFAARAARPAGVVHVFVQHTSCSLLITENADPDVRRDLETLAQRWAPDGDRAYRHDTEGDDDMAAHARSVLSGTSVTVPFADGRLLLGTWQGIYLWEHRAQAHMRTVVMTIL
ncbi:MAG TPA: secondary thiamine-phosphate synthase enzyme YjbQ [Rhodocyclaceae bacterium]|nr:secondary thiamine-phosphate synthase enzyme YjbQ [Rhodocyclaceae bacterium]